MSSTKDERPTLAGVNVKTRKRNIVVPSDPGSFADAVIQILQDAADGGASIEKDLEAGVKALDSVELDFVRYAETLFEVFFAGGRLTTGGNLAEDSGHKLNNNILSQAAQRDAILPFVKVFQTLLRRRPSLIRGLESTLSKFILSLDFYDDEKKKKLAIATALVFHLKLKVAPENVLSTLMNDRLVAKGSVLDFVTTFFKEFLSHDSLDDLVTILIKGKAVNRLLDFFPPSKRTQQDFVQHFQNAGLQNLVDWNVRREIEVKVLELQTTVSDMLQEDPPQSPAEVIEAVKVKKAETNLPDTEIVKVLWSAILKSINMTGKNQQQIMQGVMKQVKAHGKLLAMHASSGKAELSLLVTVQLQCYEDNRLLKSFREIVKLLYDAEILGEDTIMHWYKKGSHPKGRAVFLKDIEPFIKWLEEAEEEEEDEENE